ncbi:MAG: hypothetical protein AABW90_00325 [Nanoarchaeota archaeon]
MSKNELKRDNYSLEQRIQTAVKSIFDQFENRAFPSKIVIKNSNGLENFKEVLERELFLRDYKIKVVINPVKDLKKVSKDNQVEVGYIIDVINYLNQNNYPERLM